MRKIVVCEHVTLDGFVAGPNGEMNWIKLDEAMFDFVGKITEGADAALYGRITYEMMEAYWPTAADQPNASKHDVEHSQWYNKVDKIVLSKSLSGKEKNKTTFIGDAISEKIGRIKKQAGKDILMFGSPSAAHALMEHNLIDEYWLFVNPVLLGRGIPLFGKISSQVDLKPGTVKSFTCGVTALQHTVQQKGAPR